MWKKYLCVVGIILGIIMLLYVGFLGYMYFTFDFDICGIGIKKEIIVDEQLKLVHFIYGCGPDNDVSNNISIIDINHTVTEDDTGNVTVRNDDGYYDEIDILIDEYTITFKIESDRDFFYQVTKIKGYDIMYEIE